MKLGVSSGHVANLFPGRAGQVERKSLCSVHRGMDGNSQVREGLSRLYLVRDGEHRQTGP